MFYPYQHSSITKGYRPFDSFGGVNPFGDSSISLSTNTSTSDVSSSLSDLNTFTISLWYRFTGLRKGDYNNNYPRALQVKCLTPSYSTPSGYTERSNISIYNNGTIEFEVHHGGNTGQKWHYFNENESHIRACFSGWNHLVISSGHAYPAANWLRFFWNGSEIMASSTNTSGSEPIGGSNSTYQWGARGNYIDVIGTDVRLLSAVIVPGELRPYTDFAQFNSYGQLEYKPYSGPTSAYSHEVTTKNLGTNQYNSLLWEDRGKVDKHWYSSTAYGAYQYTTSDHPDAPAPKLSAFNHKEVGLLLTDGNVVTGTTSGNTIFAYNFPFEQTTLSDAQKIYFEFEIPDYAFNSVNLPSGPGKICICTDLSDIGGVHGTTSFNDCLLITEDGAGLSEDFGNGVTTTFSSSPTQDWRPGQRYKVAINFYTKELWVGYCGSEGLPGYWSAQIGGSQPTDADVSATASFDFSSVLNGTAFYVGAFVSGSPVTNHNGNSSQPMIAFYTQSGEFGDEIPSGFSSLAEYVAPRRGSSKRSYAAQNPQEYVKALTYTGNGGSQTLDVGFQPDLALFVNASGSSITKPTFFDSTNGDSVALPVARENPVTNRLDCQFTSTGLLLGNNASSPGTSGYQQSIFTNQLNSVYKAFCWRKSANAGFDVVSYVGNGSTQAISHNCGGPVHFMMIKCVDSTQTSGSENAWVTWHRGAATSTQMQEFWEFGAEGSVTINANEPRFNNQIPTSSNFYVGNDNSVNQNGKNYIAYLWTTKPGFSAFGQGTVQYAGARGFCGFKPAIVILKNQYDNTPNIVLQNTDLLFGYDGTSTSSELAYLTNYQTYEGRFGVWADGDGGDLNGTYLSNVITYHPDGFEVFNDTYNLFGYQQANNASRGFMDNRFVWAAFAQPTTGVSR